MHKVLAEILNKYKEFDEVQAVAIGGSSAAKTSDTNSDIDIYVFVKSDIPVCKREELIKKYSTKYEVGGEYFGSGDEFFVEELSQQLDVMFWNTVWFKSIVNNTWIEHFPQNGYTTAFLYTLKNLEIFYEKDDFLSELQNVIKSEYPEELKANIIRRNLMLLKDKPFASYYEQIEKAIKRNDLTGINNRISAFMASYFDIIFALNKLLHPGEKRLVKYAKNHCKILPENFEENISALLIQPNPQTLRILDDMTEKLKKIL